MADRLASDHPTVETVRASLDGTTTGYALDVPADERERFPTDAVVRIVLGGDERFARVERALVGDDLTVPGVYDTPDLARNPADGEDRLDEWVERSDVREGGSVLLDVVEPDFLYGLRSPGETQIYEAKEPPSDSLASIADDLEGGSQ